MFNLLGEADIQELMIDLNTTNQLKKLNENPLGEKLNKIGGNYSPQYAKLKGVAISKISLNKDGDYYKTFRIIPFPNGTAKITSNNKIHGNKTFLANERWGKVEGLNEKNTIKVLKALDVKVVRHLLS